MLFNFKPHRSGLTLQRDPSALRCVWVAFFICFTSGATRGTLVFVPRVTGGGDGTPLVTCVKCIFPGKAVSTLWRPVIPVTIILAMSDRLRRK